VKIKKELWDTDDDTLDFEYADIDFDKDVLIEKIQTTCKEHTL
jgi:hypothetical protein